MISSRIVWCSHAGLRQRPRYASVGDALRA